MRLSFNDTIFEFRKIPKICYELPNSNVSDTYSDGGQITIDSYQWMWRIHFACENSETKFYSHFTLDLSYEWIYNFERFDQVTPSHRNLFRRKSYWIEKLAELWIKGFSPCLFHSIGIAESLHQEMESPINWRIVFIKVSFRSSNRFKTIHLSIERQIFVSANSKSVKFLADCYIFPK